MKKYLRLIAVLLVCILLGGCGSNKDFTEPDSILSKGEKVITRTDAPYSGEFEILSDPEKVELKTYFGDVKEFYKIKIRVNNTSENNFSMPYAYGITLVNAEKKEIFSKTMLVETQSDEIKEEIAPGTTEEGYVYLDALSDDNDKKYKFSDARYIRLSVLVDAEQNDTQYRLYTEEYYLEFK